MDLLFCLSKGLENKRVSCVERNSFEGRNTNDSLRMSVIKGTLYVIRDQEHLEPEFSFTLNVNKVRNTKDRGRADLVQARPRFKIYGHLSGA